MDTHVNYTLVGVFVITLVSAIIFGIIWLSSGLSLQANSTYLVYMQESVSGLSVDATVEFNGVNVGNVRKISINHDNPKMVELLLRIKTSTPITRGTVATLGSRGLTGITYIALQDKGTDLRPLKVVDGHPFPIIKTAPSLLLRLDTALNKITTSFQNLSHSIQGMLDKENQQAFKRILIQTDKATAQLAIASEQLAPLFESAQDTVKQFELQTLPRANQMMGNVSDLSTKIKQNPAVLIRGIERPPLGPGEVP